MANKMFTEFRQSLEKKVCDLFGKINFGTNGAPTLVSVDATTKASYSKGLKTCDSPASSGVYALGLDNPYVKLLGINFNFVGSQIPANMGIFCIDALSSLGGVCVVKFASVVATNAITINGVVFLCVASGATGNQFNVGGTDTISATNLAAVINASVTAGIAGMVTATSIGPNLIIKSTKKIPASQTAGATMTLAPAANTNGWPSIVFVTCTGATIGAPASGEMVLFEVNLSNTNAF
jgi:hypothetical protein